MTGRPDLAQSQVVALSQAGAGRAPWVLRQLAGGDRLLLAANDWTRRGLGNRGGGNAGGYGVKYELVRG